MNASSSIHLHLFFCPEIQRTILKLVVISSLACSALTACFPASVACLTNVKNYTISEAPCCSSKYSAGSVRGQIERVCPAFLWLQPNRSDWMGLAEAVGPQELVVCNRGAAAAMWGVQKRELELWMQRVTSVACCPMAGD